MSIYTGNVPYNPPRNILLNGNFRLWSAGTSFNSFANNTEVPVADDWAFIQNPDGGTAPAITVSRQPFTLGARPPTIPPANPKYYLQIANSSPGSNLGKNSFIALRQHVSDVSSLTDQEPCIIEFWLKSATAQMNIAVEIEQQFGTGGSPSPIAIIGQQSFPIYDTGWNRYEVSFTPGTLLGKTAGTNGDSNITINIYIQAGSNTGIISQPALFLPAANTIGIFGVRVFPLNVAPVETQDNPPYTLPIAANDSLGGIKVGSGLEIQEDGTLSASGGAGIESVQAGSGIIVDSTDPLNPSVSVSASLSGIDAGGYQPAGYALKSNGDGTQSYVSFQTLSGLDASVLSAGANSIDSSNGLVSLDGYARFSSTGGLNTTTGAVGPDGGDGAGGGAGGYGGDIDVTGGDGGSGTGDGSDYQGGQGGNGGQLILRGATGADAADSGTPAQAPSGAIVTFPGNGQTVTGPQNTCTLAQLPEYYSLTLTSGALTFSTSYQTGVLADLFEFYSGSGTVTSCDAYIHAPAFIGQRVTWFSHVIVSSITLHYDSGISIVNTVKPSSFAVDETITLLAISMTQWIVVKQ